MKTPHWKVVVGALVVAGGGAWVVQRVRVATPVVQVERPASPGPVAAAPNAPAVEPVRGGCSFTSGQRFDVALTLKTGVELPPGRTPMPMGTVVAESLAATARLEVVEADDTRAVLLGELADAHTTGSTPAGAYGGGFLVEVEKDCEVTRFARHQNKAPVDARLQQAAVWELGWRWTDGEQMVKRPNPRGVSVWRASTARVGQDVVAQQRLEAYEQLWVGGSVADARGFATVKASGALWFDTLELDESLTTSSGITRTALRATAKLASGALRDLDRDQSHYVWVDLLAKQLARREAMPVTPGDRALRALMHDKEPAEAVQLVQAAYEKEQNLAKAWPPLRAYLEEHPEKTGEVVGQLKEGKVTETGLNPFFIALGNARTPEARDSLLGLMRDTKAPPTVRGRAMFSLVDRADVGKELAQEFSSSAQALESNPTGSNRFVASESLLALSTMAGLHEDVDVREVALGAVRARLRPEADRRTQGTALRAMANLGDPALLSEAEPYTRSPEERVRRAATKVVRRMNPADTDAFTINWLSREPSLFVKKDLFSTLELQHFDAKAKVSAPLTRLLLTELKNEAHGVIARKALVRLVGQSVLAEQADVRAELKAQARRALKRRDGLASDVMKLLTPEEVREVAP